MSENVDYPRRRSIVMESPATFAVLAVNVAVFVVQYYFLRTFHARVHFEDTYALSLDGLKSGHYWQLLTYQFMHANRLHILLNSWAIFVFGRAVEETLGAGRMLGLYFLSGVVGGLFQMAGIWLLPGLFDDAAVVGASAGAFGLVAAFAALYPHERLLMLLFFVIPLAMRARTLLGISVALALFGIFYPYFRPWIHRHIPAQFGIDQLFANIGHAAHLGGIVAGFFTALWFKRDRPSRAVI